jgi:redox-sensitive bicupin YhaK (pirin superfamily)
MTSTKRTDRRTFIGTVAAASAAGAVVSGCHGEGRAATPASTTKAAKPASDTGAAKMENKPTAPATSPVRTAERLTFPWKATDPFLFCAYHLDNYPEGDERMAPKVSLVGRNIGSDFSGRDGWSMYHGDTVPGFPRHPHRGFETITVARSGHIDHSDSLGATARFGAGDAQWMTAGQGVVHAEMFPLRHQDKPNPVELFQVWLNLPKRSKFVKPYFTMLWREKTPVFQHRDADGRVSKLMAVAGALPDAVRHGWTLADPEVRSPQPPPPDSWASQPGAEVAVWTIDLAPHARCTLPAASAGLNRTLYFFRGKALTVGPEAVAKSLTGRTRLVMEPTAEVPLQAGPDGAQLLMLQGRPIGEPVAQYGPFVMNTQEEIRQAFADYRRTGFGGWPWQRDDPAHPREQARFAKHVDGRIEYATGGSEAG